MGVQDKVTRIIAEQAMLEPEDISPSDRLDALGVDSMALVECIFAIEETFGITVPFNANAPDAAGFDISTVSSVSAAVERLIAEQSAPS